MKVGDGMRGALGYAKTADRAFIEIIFREIILDRRRIEGTNLNTYAACNAAYAAVFPCINTLVL